MKKLSVIFSLFAIICMAAPTTINAGATCAPCGAAGPSIVCPSNPNGSACGYWYPAPNVAAVQCHPSGNIHILDCEGLEDENLND